MRIAGLLTAAVFLHAVVAAQHPFVLAGRSNITAMPWIYLQYATPSGVYKKDSSRIGADGSFQFKGEVSYPAMAFLTTNRKQVSDDDPNKLSFWIEPSRMTISLKKNEFKKAVITGSVSQEQFAELRAEYDKISERMKFLTAEYSNEKDADKKAAIREKMEPFFNEYTKADLAFIERYPQSYVSAFQLIFQVSSQPVELLEKYYSALGPKVQESHFAKQVAKEIEGIRRGSPGATATNFKTKDIDERPVNLDEYKGKKYVLIDFWASWCVPCRKGNPHLRDVYAKYKDQGLEIIGVSDDDSKPDAWRKAVATDSIGIWKHVLRGLDWDKRNKGIDNPEDISELYGIHSLPTKILIDKNGVIIGRFDSDEAELDKKLKEIFGS